MATGTRRPNQARLKRRIESVLRPYLAGPSTWYTGCNGDTDDAVLAYLAENGQKPIAVGYGRFSESRGARELLRDGRAQFVDAAMEAIPRGLTGPNERDIFFCTKADLVIVFWDGESRGTKRLTDYFQENGRSLLISYI